MPSTIRDLTELTAVAVDDYFLVSDTSDVTNRDKRISQANLVATATQRSGTPTANRIATWLNATTVQDGGFLASDISRLSQVQTFTAAQTIQSPGASTVALTVNADAASTGPAQNWNRGGVLVASVAANPGDRNFNLSAFDNGASYGPYIAIAGNNNAATPSAAWISLAVIGGLRRLWVDAAGNLRIHTAPPTNATDSAGVVVGAQTSVLSAKTLLGDGIAPAAALSKLLETPVVEFEYKSKAYNATRFHGIISDWSPEFAMDDNRSFNPISAFGYVVQSTKALVEMINELQNRIQELERKLVD